MIMNIEFLYFDGCPSWKKAFDDLITVKENLGIETEIQMIDIKSEEDVQKYRFLGSPSIRINGQDIEEKIRDDTEYSMRCRVYRDGLMLNGWPPKELIENGFKGIED